MGILFPVVFDLRQNQLYSAIVFDTGAKVITLEKCNICYANVAFFCTLPISEIISKTLAPKFIFYFSPEIFIIKNRFP